MHDALQEANRVLAGRFRGVFSKETVVGAVEDPYEQLRERSTVGPNFMPIQRVPYDAEAVARDVAASGLPASTPTTTTTCRCAAISSPSHT
jgi:hypothetical protein